MLPHAELGRRWWHLLIPSILPHAAPPPQPRHIDFWFLGFAAPSTELPTSPVVVMAHTWDCPL